LLILGKKSKKGAKVFLKKRIFGVEKENFGSIMEVNHVNLIQYGGFLEVNLKF